MVAISDYLEITEAFGESSNSQPLQSKNRLVVRTLSSFFGTTFMLASVGLWIFPSNMMDAEMMLMRLVLSLFLFGVGAVFVQNGRENLSREFEIDRKNGEIRVLELGENGVSRLVQSINYKDIGHVNMIKGTMTVVDHQGDSVLEIPMPVVEDFSDIEAAFSPLTVKAA